MTDRLALIERAEEAHRAALKIVHFLRKGRPVEEKHIERVVTAALVLAADLRAEGKAPK